MIDNSTILITGGTGSFGKYFIKTIIEKHNPKKIVIFSRDELKQWDMQLMWPSTNKLPIRYFIGDVRDKERLIMAMEGVDIVIHSAALKQVPSAEYNPFEVIKTNIIGAQNVIDAAIQNKVKRVIALSTDKAAAPVNLYGATKLTSDKLFIAANNYKGWNDIKFSVVRYGNVMGSRGSVIPFFIGQFKEGKELTITDTKMTRFNITLKEGVEFVIKSLERMYGGEIFIPKLPSYNILDVAKAISPKLNYKITSIRPGEKLHEEMITVSDSRSSLEFDDYYVICPSSDYLQWNMDNYEDIYSGKKGQKLPHDYSYSSENNSNFLSVKELKSLIDENL